MKANDRAERPAMAASGRLVAFESLASNLFTGDGAGSSDVFVRNLSTGLTTLISRNTDGVPANGQSGSVALSNNVPAIAISNNGRFVAFASLATNLSAGDTSDGLDVYLSDLLTGTVTFVSRADGAGANSDLPAIQPHVSDDGRVVYATSSSNLDPDDKDGAIDIYVRDGQNTILVSRATGSKGTKPVGAAAGNGRLPQLSGDGRSVAFGSLAASLDPADNDHTPDIFVRNLDDDTTTLISRATGGSGTKGNAESRAPSLSQNGRRVAFASLATNLHPADTDSASDIFVRDRDDDTTTLVSRATGALGAKGDSASSNPRLSADGRYVIFESTATNLDPADTQPDADVFRRDLETNATTLVSRSSGVLGVKGNGASTRPAISGDGRYVTFQSEASNLDPADSDTVPDTFLRELPATSSMPPDRDDDKIADADDQNDASRGPTFKRTAVLKVIDGAVRVTEPGEKSRPLLGAEVIPLGALVDARDGMLDLTSKPTASTQARQATRIHGGIFVISQSNARRPYTDLDLRLPPVKPCPGTSRARAAAVDVSPSPAARLGLPIPASQRPQRTAGPLDVQAARTPRRINPLVITRDRYRIKAKNSRSSAAGTIWTTQERCDGTVTTVIEGVVNVRDKRTEKVVRVTAGETYIARPGRRR